MPQQSSTDKAHEFNKGYFPITSLHRDDIKQAYCETDNYEMMCKIADSMEDHEMENLASKMADDYCEQLFWDSLTVIFEDHYGNKMFEYQEKLLGNDTEANPEKD